MARFFGTTEKNVVEGNKQTIVFRIPAFSKRGASERAKLNARVKGFEDAEVGSVERVGDASIPGQSQYDVEVVRLLS